jgi:hypothetical protein
MSKPCHVITYGKDEVLLSTRKSVLKTAGFESDTAKTAEDFVGCITSSDRGYDIFILCHSVPPDEQDVIVEAAKGSDVEVYVLTTLVQPEQFIERVRELAQAC